MAECLAKALPGCEIHGLAKRVPDAESTFESTGTQLQGLFLAGRPIIGVCAAGVLVRLLAPLLRDKTTEPPVIAVAEDGSVVVPLLGGHHGANDLAQQIAEVLGGVAAVTTSGDLRFGVALDDPPAGYRLAAPERAKPVMARLLEGEAVRLAGYAPWLNDSKLPFGDDAALTLRVAEEVAPEDPDVLVYHPATLALGLGCERNCPPEELVGLVRETLAESGFAPESLAVAVSLDLKMDEPAMAAVSEAFGVPLRFFDAGRLEEETPRLSQPSDIVYREVGCHGVSEAAALAAAGPEGALVVTKRKSRRATSAIARSVDLIDPESVGVARGLLSIVGLGPGQEAWRTPEADRLLRDATDLVGYGFYLDLLGSLAEGKTRHVFALGEEEKRAEAALRLAAEGRNVALISSGDPGIYAMAAVAYEVLDRALVAGNTAYGRIDLQVAPGISALQAAAARLGAPLGHDFCAISLSDLLTPWETIETRLRAAAEGDFVVAFYNPVSKRRRWQLGAARDILLKHRPPETPVVLATSLGRPQESIRSLSLKDLDPEDVDMMTVVLVGNSQTRRVETAGGRSWLLTPRGYAAKAEKRKEAS